MRGMSITNKILKCATAKALVVSLIATSVWMRPETSFAFIPPEDHYIDFKSITVIRPLDDSFLNAKTLNAYLPTNMSPGTDQNLFYTQLQTGIEDRVTRNIYDYIMKSPLMRDSGVTKT